MVNLFIRAAALVADRVIIPRRGDRGATAVEYALIIAGVAAVLAVVVFALEDVITDLFKETCRSVAEGGTSTNAPASCTAGTPAPNPQN